MNVIALLLLAFSFQTTSKPVVTNPPPNIKSATLADENAILKAEHNLDQANLQKQQAQDQFLQIRQNYQDADKRAKDAEKALNDAMDAAYTHAGVDKKEWTLDPAGFVFVKNAPAPANAPKNRP